MWEYISERISWGREKIIQTQDFGQSIQLDSFQPASSNYQISQCIGMLFDVNDCAINIQPLQTRQRRIEWRCDLVLCVEDHCFNLVRGETENCEDQVLERCLSFWREVEFCTEEIEYLYFMVETDRVIKINAWKVNDI